MEKTNLISNKYLQPPMANTPLLFTFGFCHSYCLLKPFRLHISFSLFLGVLHLFRFKENLTFICCFVSQSIFIETKTSFLFQLCFLKEKFCLSFCLWKRFFRTRRLRYKQMDGRWIGTLISQWTWTDMKCFTLAIRERECVYKVCICAFVCAWTWEDEREKCVCGWVGEGVWVGVFVFVCVCVS